MEHVLGVAKAEVNTDFQGGDSGSGGNTVPVFGFSDAKGGGGGGGGNMLPLFGLLDANGGGGGGGGI